MGLSNTEQMYDWDGDGKLNSDEELRYREFITGEWEDYVDSVSAGGSSRTHKKSDSDDDFLTDLIKSLIMDLGIGCVFGSLLVGAHIPFFLFLLIFFIGVFLILIGR